MTFHAFYMGTLRYMLSVHYTQMIIYHSSENNSRWWLFLFVFSISVSSSFALSVLWLCAQRYFVVEWLDARTITIIVIIWLTAKNQTFLMPSKHLRFLFSWQQEIEPERCDGAMERKGGRESESREKKNLFFIFWLVFIFSSFHP